MKKIIVLLLLIIPVLLFTGCTNTETQTVNVYGGIHAEKIATTIGSKVPTNIKGFKLQFSIVNEGSAPIPEKNVIVGLPPQVEGVVCLISPNKLEWDITGKVCEDYIFKRGMKEIYEEGKLVSIKPERVVITLPKDGLIKPPELEFARMVSSITIKNCYTYYTYGVVSGCILLKPELYERMEELGCDIKLMNTTKGPLEIRKVEPLGPIIEDNEKALAEFIVELSKRRAEDQIYDFNEIRESVANGKCPGTLYPGKLDKIYGYIYVADPEGGGIIGEGRCVQNDLTDPLLFTCTVEIDTNSLSSKIGYLPVSFQLIFSYGVINIEKIRDVELIAVPKAK